MDSILDPLKKAASAEWLEEAKELFNIGDIVVEVVDYFDVGDTAFNRYLQSSMISGLYPGLVLELGEPRCLYPVGVPPEAYLRRYRRSSGERRSSANRQKFHFLWRR